MNHNGLSTNKVKRSWKICPRCGVEAISRPARKCLACKGRVQFGDVDNFALCIELIEPFYVWAKPVSTNLEGWYPASFFGVTFGGRK